MMNKAEAAAFLRSLAESATDPPKQPRVIVVRASRQTKSFVARALEQLERAGQVLEAAAGTDTAAELTACFGSVAYVANEYKLHHLTDAARHAETLAGLTHISSAAERSKLVPTFKAILKYLSAAMLRVYVDGNDQNCTEELMVIRKLVAHSSPKEGFLVTTQGSGSQLLN